MITTCSFCLLGGSHCTSKLDAFEDLEEMETLGFRGEAFHSLCVLSKSVLLITRHREAEIGIEVQFNNMAVKMAQKPVPSSVIVLNLYQVSLNAYKSR
jgi:DNA mismatch repair ATPase MutL